MHEPLFFSLSRILLFSREPTDVFRLKVTADIRSKKGITGYELNRIFEEEIDEKNKIGDWTVKKDDGYQILVVEGNLYEQSMVEL